MTLFSLLRFLSTDLFFLVYDDVSEVAVVYFQMFHRWD